MRERRKKSRFICFFRAEAHSAGKKYSGYAVNVSLTGCGFAHENLLAIEESDDVQLKLKISGRDLTIRTQVRWRDETIMGLHFKTLTAPAKKLLQEYIQAANVHGEKP